MELLIVVGIVAMCVILIRTIDNWILSINKNDLLPKKMSRRLGNGGKILLCFLAALVIAQVTGNLTAAWTFVTAVLGGIALGFFAMWSVLSNVTSTLLLVAFKQADIGEHIEIIETGGQSVKGHILDINLFFTTLREDTGTTVRVPNNFFFQRTVRTYPTQILD